MRSPANLLRITLLALVALAAHGASDALPGAGEFRHGRDLYDADDFKGARRAFERALEQAPEDSEYNHWLGKAYGRMAEESSFLSALTYADRTRRFLERAVELDGENRDALWSLMLYYEEAPGFLGGSDKKAAELRRRLDVLGDAVASDPAPSR